MAKLQDRFMNRIIDGDLTFEENEEKQIKKIAHTYINVGNITALSDEQINRLGAGDIVLKKTGNQFHAYVVSYKENGQGICLTYTDASRVETVSYDLVGEHWVYNSTDVTLLLEPLMENVVDQEGHKRFIEGDGTPLTQTGVNISYCKWSLSGTHLMMVVAGNIANETVIANGATLARFTLPEWVSNKIYPVWGTGYIERKSLSLTAENWSIQNLTIALFKDSASMRILSIDNALTLNADRSFRVAFDLLIDNEQPVGE